MQFLLSSVCTSNVLSFLMESLLYLRIVLIALTISFNFHRNPEIVLFRFLTTNKESAHQSDLAVTTLPAEDLSTARDGAARGREPPDGMFCEVQGTSWGDSCQNV